MTSVGERPIVVRRRRSRPVLTGPAPTRAELVAMLEAAAAAPDHGRLRPWRFVVVEGAALDRLGDAYAAALLAREPDAPAADVERARTRPHRAPVVVVVVARPRLHPRVTVRSQHATAASVAYGLVLAAEHAGYGAMWRSGWFGDDPIVRAHLGLATTEDVTGWIYLGTPAGPEPPPRPVADVPVTWLD